MSHLRGLTRIYLRNYNHNNIYNIHKSYNIITWSKYNKSVNSMKARSKKKVEAGLKKSKDNSNQKSANDGLTYEEIKARDLERIKAKQQAFEEKQKLEQEKKGKKK